MKESDVNGKARDMIVRECLRAKVYKHCDRMTAGIPDTTVTWRGYTSWLEFKMLEARENVHDQLDTIQLVELVRLEQQCGRAWVIAYRKAHVTKLVTPRTLIYRPTKLLAKFLPIPERFSKLDSIYEDLQHFGVAELDGFNHHALTALIHRTHV